MKSATGLVASGFLALGLPGSLAAQCDRLKLIPGDGGDGQEFSWSVAVDGATVLVGAFGRSADTIAGGGYFFERIGGAWMETAKLVSPGTGFDGFGQAVALDQDRALFGARYDDTRGTDAGAAFLFARVGGSWTLEAPLTALDGSADDEFGQTVALSGDTALLGAAYDDEDGAFAGSAYVFQRVDGVWTQVLKLKADDAKTGDVFGASVAVDGDLLAVAAPGDDTFGSNTGAVYVFRREQGSWIKETKITPGNLSEHAGFGHAISLSGEILLVGAYGNDEQAQDAGAAFVYRRSGTSWTEEAKLLATEPGQNHILGFSVAIDGDLAIAGAFGDRHGGTLSQAGSAHVFRRQAGQWSHVARLIDTTPESQEYFGFSVAAGGEHVLVGSPDDHELGFARGGATLVSMAAAEGTLYGSGWPGSSGVPTILNLTPPVLGGNLIVQVGNSAGPPTTGFLLLGFSAGSVPTFLGGTLLLVPSSVFILLIPPAGLDLQGMIPDDPRLCGVDVFLQALESDAGASHGFSFTQGLQLHLGD